ncbi:hypothetical protein DVH24_014594 [Malus domestica]|uniref:Leucine-rich repeat-containing N-terminal plant-type domain-containing protein n=1 Tax=Malus domestica TaxID=3750 RepID=A0A498KJW1_MALDO|nr:hypothetical protein DVH24_014594 [Malus domestica]
MANIRGKQSHVSSQHNIKSHFSSKQRFGSQERENSVKRVKCISQDLPPTLCARIEKKTNNSTKNRDINIESVWWNRSSHAFVDNNLNVKQQCLPLESNSYTNGEDIMCLKLFHASIIVVLIVLQYFNISLSLEFNNISLGVVGHRDIVKVPKRGKGKHSLLSNRASQMTTISYLHGEEKSTSKIVANGQASTAATGRITQLNLRQSYLSEAYSLQEEGDPEFYYHLQVATFEIFGEIDFNGSQFPDFIGSLSNLRHLDLSDASFAGRFPSHVGNLTHLQYLDLSFNFFANVENLNSWPPNLSSLTYLNMSSSNLSNVYDWMEAVNKLPKLTNLTLTKCGLPSLIHPSTLFNINSSKYLAHVDLNSNQFTSPSIFLWLSNYNVSLVYLDLSYNSITGLIPHVFGNMKPLAFLHLGYNHLVGSWRYTYYKLLNCVYDWLYVRVALIKNCTRLTIFYVGENKLSGLITEWLGVGLSNLTILILRSNHFYGSIPSQLCNMGRIQILDFSMNNISRSISKCLNSLTNLAQKRSSSLTIHHYYSLGNETKSEYDDEQGWIHIGTKLSLAMLPFSWRRRLKSAI